MRFIAVDDEKMALENILKEIGKAVGEESEHEIAGFRKPSEAIAYVEKSSCDVAFLDIEMREMSGLALAQHLKEINSKINIIFTTGYDEFAGSAFELYASGYCLKPVTAQKIQSELANLRYPVEEEKKNRLRIVTFGNFEAFVDNKPLKFQYNRTKELLAYLIDRNGALCSNQEIMEVLWEDNADFGKHSSYMKNLRADLFATLIRAGCEDVFERQRGMTAILPDKVDCDYFDLLRGKPEAVNSYRGEYMMQYSWSEYTHGMLENKGL